MINQTLQKIQGYKIKIRKLIDGSEVEELDKPVNLIIYTKAPQKWKIIDMETGQEYIGNKDQHPVFGEMLREKVSLNGIGQWKKIKK